MKRTGVMTCLLLVAACLLAGCGQTEESVETDQTVTIQYFTWTSSAMSVIEPMVEKFNATNEDHIRVELVLKTGEWQTALKTAILSGQAPDILHGVQDVTEALSNGWIEPWDSYLSEEFREEIDPYAYKVEVDGNWNTYAFFNEAKTYKMAYNRELFEKAGITELPTTWEEIYTCAKKITDTGHGEYYGFGLSSATIGSAVPFIMEPVGAYEGYYKMGYDFRRNRFDFTYLEPYIQMFRDMIAEGIAFPGASALDNDGIRAQFAAGKIGILPSVSWDCAAINDQFKTSCDWDVFDWPCAIGGENGGAMCLRDTANYMLSSSSRHKEEAAKFLEYMLGADYQSEMLARAAEMSILPWAVEAAEEKPKSEYPQWEHYQVTEDMLHMANVNLSVQVTGDTEAVTMTKLVNDSGIDAAAALSDLSDRYNEGLYRQAQTDEEKAEQSGVRIGFLGRIMAVENFDPKKSIAAEDICYLTPEEWLAASGSGG